MNRHNIYTELLQRHLPMMRRMCWLQSRGDYERCRDLLQEVSIALWLHLDQLRPDASAREEKAWVRWLTRTTLDHQNRRQRPPMVALTDILEETIPNKDDISTNEDIEDLMAVLSPEEQSLMRLHFEGYHAGEIAKIMGLRRDAVYQRMHRAEDKARRILLVVLLLMVTGSIAIAVVPSWRQRVFGGGEPKVVDTIPVSAPSVAPPAQTAVADTLDNPVVRRQPWIPPEPVPHLVFMADTTLPLPPIIEDLCGCSDTAYNNARRLDCGLQDDADADTDLPVVESEISIMVSGSIIIVEGARDELVDVYDSHGHLVASAQCNGRCTLTIMSTQYDNFPSPLAYWVQVGKRPRQKVFVKPM